MAIPIPIQSQAFNPITGVFGTGQVQFFASSGTWTVPPGVGKVRVRVFGAGGGYFSSSPMSPSGGGFAFKAIYDLTGVTSVAVTVGAAGTANVAGNTSSFGSYCSATGGQTGSADGVNAGGTGTGGDINTSGGSGVNSASGGGGGVGNLFGKGGNGTTGIGGNGASGGGGSTNGGNNCPGGHGFLGRGAGGGATISNFQPTTGQEGGFSIDFIGTGGGGNGPSPNGASGINGGGGGGGSGGGTSGGFPGGGAGYNGVSAGGLVIVEW
jgi:hypothetical protein